MSKKGEQDGSDRVGRGGCWSSDARFARVARWVHVSPGDRVHVLGFRLARHRSALARLAESLQEVDDGQEG